jgi:CheY-like chemotaxis protein
MIVTCLHCSASLTVPEERLPKDTDVTATCPRCKGRIVLYPTESVPTREVAVDVASAAAVAVSPEPPAYSEEAQPQALVCTSAPAEREQVLAILTREGYAMHLAADAADAIARLRFTPYALVLLREGFGSATGDQNPVLESLAEMAMATRRLMHVLLVSPGVRSHDSAIAFARSVDLVLHVDDLPHLAEALKRSRLETAQAYRVLLESLRAAGKG